MASKIIKKKYTQGAGGHVADATYFYYETAPDFNKQLAIVCGGYEKCAPDFNINRSNYPYHFIKCTLKGKGTLRMNDRVHALRPGMVTGFAPGTSHHYSADPHDPMEHLFITFVGTEADELLKTSLLADRGIIQPSNPSEILELADKIFNTGLNKGAYSQQICCHYLRILSLIVGRDAHHLQQNYSQSMATYLECKRYIDEHFSKLVSLQEVARDCGVHPRYMSTLFKRYGQNAPHEYMMRLKLNKAANLLLTSTLSVKEIAYAIGFEDPYHFSRNFKKFHGLSPRDYRNRHM